MRKPSGRAPGPSEAPAAEKSWAWEMSGQEAAAPGPAATVSNARPSPPTAVSETLLPKAGSAEALLPKAHTRQAPRRRRPSPQHPRTPSRLPPLQHPWSPSRHPPPQHWRTPPRRSARRPPRRPRRHPSTQSRRPAPRLGGPACLRRGPRHDGRAARPQRQVVTQRYTSPGGSCTRTGPSRWRRPPPVFSCASGAASAARPPRAVCGRKHVMVRAVEVEREPGRVPGAPGHRVR